MHTDDEDMFSEATATLDSPLSVVAGKTLSRAFQLRQLSGPGCPREFALSQDRVVLGRSQQADVVVDTPELSRLHVLFEKEGHEYSVRDLDSRNGLYLNGVKIHSALLRGGDMLQMGNVTFLCLEGC